MVMVNAQNGQAQVAPKADAMDIIAMLLRENNELRRMQTVASGNGNGGGSGRGGRHVPQPVVDTKTGVVYRTKASAGKAVCAEYGISLFGKNGKINNFVWYEVIKADSTRFKEISAEEYNRSIAAAPVTTSTVTPAVTPAFTPAFTPTVAPAVAPVVVEVADSTTSKESGMAELQKLGEQALAGTVPPIASPNTTSSTKQHGKAK